MLGEQRSRLGPHVGDQEGGVVDVGLEEELVSGVLRVQKREGGAWLCALASTTRRTSDRLLCAHFRAWVCDLRCTFASAVASLRR